MQTQTPSSSIGPRLAQSSHSRWLALTHRTPTAHSSFLYGVKSTKIYCRPTCTARLARRANVVFYDTEDQARRDGFRPCKRCKPDDTAFVGEVEELVTRVIALLRTKKGDLTEKNDLKNLAKEVGVTPSYLCRVFKKTMGMTIGTYMKEFEREANEVETASSAQSSSNIGSDVLDAGMGLLTPETTVRSPSEHVESQKRGSTEEDVENVEEHPNLDFDFDAWLRTEDLSNHSMDEWLWQEDLLNNNLYD